MLPTRADHDREVGGTKSPIVNFAIRNLYVFTKICFNYNELR